jgi:hypothetical protein
MLLLMLSRKEYVLYYSAKYGSDSGYASGTGTAKNRYGSTTLLGRVPLGIPWRPEKITSYQPQIILILQSNDRNDMNGWNNMYGTSSYLMTEVQVRYE